jgi:sugar lactone lactonase YvrE
MMRKVPEAPRKAFAENKKIMSNRHASQMFRGCLLPSVALIALCTLFPGCAKVNVFNEPPDNPVVDSITPASGRLGTQIRIWGSGFSTFSSRDSVHINGIALRVDSPSTSTVLLATLIDSTGTGNVDVSVNGRTVDGPIFTWLGGKDTSVPTPAITKVSQGWHDGDGYAVNITALPANDADVKLFVGGIEIPVAYVARPGTPFYDPAQGLQVLTDDVAGVYAAAVDIYASFQVKFRGTPGNTISFQLQPVITDVLSKHGEYAFGIGDTLVFTGKALGHQTLPSSVTLVYNGVPLTAPAIASWTNTQIKAVMPAYPTIAPRTSLPTMIKVGTLQNAELEVQYLGQVSGTVFLIAGNQSTGSSNGRGAAASFNSPAGIVLDASGALYVADTYNNLIRKIGNIGADGGDVTTVAGSSAGLQDGAGVDAFFYEPVGMGIDENGVIYIADRRNWRVRALHGGIVTTIFPNSDPNNFKYPAGIITNNHNLVYVTEAGGHRVREIINSTLFTYAGMDGVSGFVNGTGAAAEFNQPYGGAIAPDGTLYIADEQNHAIRMIAPGGVVTTLAGSGAYGMQDGNGTAATFVYPHAIVLDAQGNLYVADFNDAYIRKITPQGVVTSINPVDTDGSPFFFLAPNGITIDSQGALYVTDAGRNAVYKLVP